MQEPRPVQCESAKADASAAKATPASDRPHPGGAPMDYRILAWLWCFVSLPAIYLLWRDPEWRQAAAGLERLRALRLEQWVALGVVVFHGFIVIRAQLQPPRATRVERREEESGKKSE